MTKFDLKSSNRVSAFMLRRRVEKYTGAIDTYYHWFLSLSESKEFREYIAAWRVYAKQQKPSTKEPVLAMIDSKTRYHFCQEFEKLFKEYLLIPEIKQLQGFADHLLEFLSLLYLQCLLLRQQL